MQHSLCACTRGQNVMAVPVDGILASGTTSACVCARLYLCARVRGERWHRCCRLVARVLAFLPRTSPPARDARFSARRSFNPGWDPQGLSPACLRSFSLYPPLPFRGPSVRFVLTFSAYPLLRLRSHCGMVLFRFASCARHLQGVVSGEWFKRLLRTQRRKFVTAVNTARFLAKLCFRVICVMILRSAVSLIAQRTRMTQIRIVIVLC